MRKFVTVMVIIILFFTISVDVIAQEYDLDTVLDIDELDYELIDTIIQNTMKDSKVPGISVVIVNGDKTKFLNYGYANKENNIQSTSETYFELGSMSKAFTALGIFLLENDGKINLDDPVTKYLPWFNVYYDGKYEGKRISQNVELTIENLLYHTSGIPFSSVGDIPQGNIDEMLEKTVRNLIGTKLDYYPGERFQYATINYDILGLIIETISNITFEEFIQINILEPLELNNTYMFLKDAEDAGIMATGYKMSFFQAIEYNAPRFRGNTPAGYVISNSLDMELWLQILLRIKTIPEKYRVIIDKVFETDNSVASQGDYHYAGGWYVNIKGKDIQHGGSNPNFSSYILFKPKQNIGVCVLSNMNSNASDYIAQNIMNIIESKEVTNYGQHTYKTLDLFFSIILVGASLLIISFMILLILAIVEVIQKKRMRTKLNGVRVAGILLSVPIMSFFGFCIYYLPNILFERLSWEAVNVWGSNSIMMGSILGFVACVIFMIYVLLTFNYPKPNEKSYIALIPLSLINGISSALIIFTINETFNRNLEYTKELLVYFVFSLVFFIYTIKLLQGRMIIITNEIAYEKRISMIDKIMCSSYQAIEMIGKDRIYSGLNNDCSAIAGIPGIVVNFVSNLLTLIFCLALLFTKSTYAFLTSIAIIIMNGILSLITSRIASKYWEKNRDIQDIYFDQMSHLVNGFKELVLNKLRRFAFWKDMQKYSRLSTELNKAASIKFLNFNLYNMLMYNIVFGVVVFIFPLFTMDIDANQLREHLFIVFYMIGPFGAVLGIIPQLTQLNVNIKRINKLINDLEHVSTGENTLENLEATKFSENISLELNNIVYRYIKINEDEEKEEGEFTLGPVSIELNNNEIVFITGGNGSGKSTLGKIITGLYSPLSGEVKLNGENIELNVLNELFASVYSDFNLFKKLYGIDHEAKKDKIDEYLNLMQIKDKIEINDEGEFKSVDLSTGQRKRLAFIISCLEDKPMLLYDEWAAEQDPHFRQFFYETLLPMLKKMGKGIIVITHDDRYFERADKLIKLERGELVEIKCK